MTEKPFLHTGGWEASRTDLLEVPVPEETPSYVPVPYGRFVEEVALHLPRVGLTVQSEAYALARDGHQMFGVLTCTNGFKAPDHTLAIGLRNSYDRSLSVGLVAGTRVFCCDNLAFMGEVQMARKHTVHVFRDLPDLIYTMLGKVRVLTEWQEEQIQAWKAREVTPAEADHLILDTVRRQIVPASRLPTLLELWDEPRYQEFRPSTGWSLYNAFTELLKSRSPRAQVEGTLKLSKLFREAFGS